MWRKVFNSEFHSDTAVLKPRERLRSEDSMNSKWVLFYISLVLFTELDPWFLQITFPKGPPYNVLLLGAMYNFMVSN